MKIVLSQEGKLPLHTRTVGLFLEDLNYCVDGGLYAEMLENRNFEAKDVHGEWDRYIVDEDGLYGWMPYPDGAAVERKIKSDRPLFPENPHYLRLKAQAGTGVKNKAYDGIYLTKGMKYNVSLWLRSYDYKGKAAVGVYRNGTALVEKKIKVKADGKWRRYSFRLKAKTDAERADFCFLLSGNGAVHLDAFSMIPENAIKGVFRRDLVELMKELKPAFLRFPGGCVVEGNSLANRYLWKNTLGPVERRKHNWNRWAVHATDEHNHFRSEFSHYGQTLGIGYYEYFLLCEYLGCKPLPVVSVGIACQYMSSEFVPLDSPELEGYIQEALDLVEFANGGEDTEWGRVRAELGHPEPFGLEMLGVGNEQWEDSPKQKDGVARPNEFYKRFELFEKRLHEKYPALKIVGTVGPTFETPTYESAWEWTKKNLEANPDFVYCSDEHFYVSPAWLYDHVNVYDNYPRNCKVYAGEYAAHVPGSGCALFNAPQANCWEGALAEAAFMTGMERNSDVVVMSSYAPLLGRLGYTQWSPDMIWFDGKGAYPSASYYVQMMYSLYTGNAILKTETDAEKVYVSASEREGLTYLKVVNAGEEELQAEIVGDHNFGQLTRIIRMQAEPGDYNTAEDPHKVEPYEEAPLSAHACVLPPKSFSVLVFRK